MDGHQLKLDPAVMVRDSSKLNDFQKCPRYFFFRHILGWTSDQPNIHLEFGTAIHLGMEKLMEGLTNSHYPIECVRQAIDAFKNHYLKHFSIEEEGQWSPKNLSNGSLALEQYCEHYNGSENFEVLYTEVAGSVPISEYEFLHFKMDTICRGAEGIFSIDHKTSSRDSTQWRRQFDLSLQMSAYTHALKCIFPNEPVFGMKVNGILLRKTGNGFIRLPIQKNDEHLLSWLFDIQYILKELDWNFDQLMECKEGDQILESFPRRTDSCTQYGVCPYLDLCAAWVNPLRSADSPPLGMTTNFWNPRSHDKEAKYLLKDGAMLLNKERVEPEVVERKELSSADFPFPT